MYAYFNNGLGFRAIDGSMALEPGEVTFPDTPTEEDLLAAFPGRPAALAAFNAVLNNDPIKAQITALEASQHRMVREAVLSGGLSRLTALDAQITALRATMTT